MSYDVVCCVPRAVLLRFKKRSELDVVVSPNSLNGAPSKIAFYTHTRVNPRMRLKRDFDLAIFDRPACTLCYMRLSDLVGRIPTRVRIR